jgi:hypothetical protein
MTMHAETQGERRGWIDAAARLARVALESPRVKASLSTILNAIDPDASPELVRTVLYTDSGVPLALAGALPDGLNAAIEALHELAQQISGFPPALVSETLGSLAGQVRIEKLGDATALLLAPAAEALVPLVLAWAEALAGRLERQLAEDDRLASAARRLSEGLVELLARHPGVDERVVAPLLRPFRERGGD